MTCTSCPYFFTLEQECRFNPCMGIPLITSQGPGILAGWPKVTEPGTGWCGNHPERKTLMGQQTLDKIRMGEP